MKSDTILILIILFFVLGCTFSCDGMKEYFSAVCQPCAEQQPICNLWAGRGDTDCCKNGVATTCSNANQAQVVEFGTPVYQVTSQQAAQQAALLAQQRAVSSGSYSKNSKGDKFYLTPDKGCHMSSKGSQFSGNTKNSYFKGNGFSGNFKQCKERCNHYNKNKPGDCVGFNMKVRGNRCYFISSKNTRCKNPDAKLSKGGLSYTYYKRV